jgi:hypothetical protein
MREAVTALCWMIGAGVLVAYGAWIIRNITRRPR